jgi:hypothetical protein
VGLYSTRAKVIAVIGGLLLLLFVAYLTWGPGHQDTQIENIVADLRRRTIPPDAEVLEDQELHRENMSVRASWTFECDQDWVAYSQLVKERCLAYKIREAGAGKLLLSQQLPGDTLSVTIEKLGDSPLKVRVSFRGYPS